MVNRNTATHGGGQITNFPGILAT